MNIIGEKTYNIVNFGTDSLQQQVRPCRLCEGCESSSDMLLAAIHGQQLPGKTVMLQATGSSYFAIQPFLKALQRSGPLPLAEHIIRLPANAGAAGKAYRTSHLLCAVHPEFMLYLTASNGSI